jgi:Flp pilus assembly protein TadG
MSTPDASKPAVHKRRERGQSMVEFALVLPLLVVLLLGILDFGRAVFMYNGLSQAARDIARVTSVHRGDPLGSSSETDEVVDGLMDTIPDMQAPTYACVDIELMPADCRPGNSIEVTVRALYVPVTPLLNLSNIDMSSTSRVQIP